MHTRAHTSHCKVSEDVLYENKSSLQQARLPMVRTHRTAVTAQPP